MNRRLSRRYALKGVAVGGAGLAAASLLACNTSQSTTSNQSNNSSGTGQVQAKRGGLLSRRDSLGTTRPYDAGLDPHPLQPTYTTLMTQFYQTVVRRDPRTADVEPELASKWEQPSPTEYILRLVPGVKFHNKAPVNGRTMTAQDVIFSLERVRTDDPRFQSRLLFSSVDKIEAIDATSVRITTKKPDVSTLGNLAATGAAVLPPEVFTRWDKLTSAETAIGTGAFILKDLDDNHSEVVRNPDYWKPGLPYLDQIHNQYFSDDSSAYAAYLGGSIDLVANPVSGPDAKKLFDEQQSKDYIAEWFKDISWTSVQANTKKKPFDDARVGLALKLLMDHQEASHEWAVTWFGRGYVTSFLPAGLDEWDFTEEEYNSKFLEYKKPKDDAVREALRLLNAAGFTRDNPLRFSTSGISGSFSGNMVELHQAQINRLGQGVVQVSDIKLMELAILNNVLARGEFDYSVSNLVPPQPYDVDSWFTTVVYSNGGRNYGKYSDPALDVLMDNQRTIFDIAQRKAKVKEILTGLIEKSPYTGWSGRYVLNVGRRKVKDWAPEGASAKFGYRYEQVWLDA